MMEKVVMNPTWGKKKLSLFKILASNMLVMVYSAPGTTGLGKYMTVILNPLNADDT